MSCLVDITRREECAIPVARGVSALFTLDNLYYRKYSVYPNPSKPAHRGAP